MNTDHQNDWRVRAQEMRALGDQMHDQLARGEMLRLANKYERLAAWTERRAPAADRLGGAPLMA